MEHEETNDCEYLLSSSESSLRVDCTLGGFDINDLNDLSFSRLLEPVENVRKKTNKNLSKIFQKLSSLKNNAQFSIS